MIASFWHDGITQLMSQSRVIIKFTNKHTITRQLHISSGGAGEWTHCPRGDAASASGQRVFVIKFSSAVTTFETFSGAE